MNVFFTELQRLALFVGDALPEKWMTCAFVARLPSYVRQHLQASSRMDDITLGQILTRAQAIMLDRKELVTAAVQLVQSSTVHTSPSISDNHVL